MKRTFLHFLLGVTILGMLSGCSVTNHTMKTPNYHIEFYKTDFDYSPQVTAEATSVRIFMIDWSRIFGWKTGDLSSDRFPTISQDVSISGNVAANTVSGFVSAVIPVVGDYGKGRISNYALYNLMQENPGYDLVIYPQYEAKKFVVPFFFSKTKVQVTARLGKIK